MLGADESATDDAARGRVRLPLAAGGRACRGRVGRSATFPGARFRPSAVAGNPNGKWVSMPIGKRPSSQVIAARAIASTTPRSTIALNVALPGDGVVESGRPDPGAADVARCARGPVGLRGARWAMTGKRLFPAVLAALALGACAGNLECDGHACVGDWKREMALGGTVVQCVDGSWSHAGGLPGACSGHRGKR